MKAKSLQDLHAIRQQVAERERIAREEAAARAEAHRRSEADRTLFQKAAGTVQQLRSHGLKLGLITNPYQPMWARDIELEAHGLAGFFSDADAARLAKRPLGNLPIDAQTFRRSEILRAAGL